MNKMLQVQLREVDATKKGNTDEVEQLKEDEMLKLRREKQAFEQRQKNFALVSKNSKKEREEIDQVRKEFNRYKAEQELKSKKQQSQIERLTKQNNELKQKNKELQEDLRAMEQQRLILEKTQAKPGVNASTPNRLSKNMNNQAPRYTFQ